MMAARTDAAEEQLALRWQFHLQVNADAQLQLETKVLKKTAAAEEAAPLASRNTQTIAAGNQTVEAVAAEEANSFASRNRQTTTTSKRRVECFSSASTIVYITAFSPPLRT
jgi:hypothetical protein